MSRLRLGANETREETRIRMRNLVPFAVVGLLAVAAGSASAGNDEQVAAVQGAFEKGAAAGS